MSGDQRCALGDHPLEAHEPRCCAACVAHVRVQLSEVEERYLLLAGEIEHHAAEQIPGGPAMVALAGGSSGIGQVRAWVNGQDDSHVADEWASDGGSVSFELARWEDEWRRLRRGPAAVVPVAARVVDRDVELRTLHAAVTYLTRHLEWAAQHCDVFGEFAADVRSLLGRVRGITRSGPQYDVPCTDCDVPLMLVDVLADPKDPALGRTGVYQCPRCRRRYDDAAYWLAVHQHFFETKVDDGKAAAQ